MIDMHNKTVVVTGANSGVGFVAAKRLAEAGAEIVMVCRDSGRGETARARIAESATGPAPQVDACADVKAGRWVGSQLMLVLSLAGASADVWPWFSWSVELPGSVSSAPSSRAGRGPVSDIRRAGSRPRTGGRASTTVVCRDCVGGQAARARGVVAPSSIRYPSGSRR